MAVLLGETGMQRLGFRGRRSRGPGGVGLPVDVAWVRRAHWSGQWWSRDEGGGRGWDGRGWKGTWTDVLGW